MRMFKQNRNDKETVANNQKETTENSKSLHNERRLGDFNTHKTHRRQVNVKELRN